MNKISGYLFPLVFTSLFLFTFLAASANAAVVTYPAPTGSNSIPLSSAFTVTADGNHVDVYQVKVAPQGVGFSPCHTGYELASMAYFDFSGTVNVQITSAVPISSVVVRPLRHGIQPAISGNTISFSLFGQANLSIEINGDDRHNLHLFANPMEVNRPSSSDPNVIYYGPGVHGNGSTIYVDDGKTLYIAGGAVVNGLVYAYGGANATIRGRGIITGQMHNCVVGGSGNLFFLTGWQNATIEGVIALDNDDWTAIFINIANLNIDNLKTIVWRGSDGLDLTSVSSALIKNVFIRALDDTFAIKSDPSFMTPTFRPTENITIQDSVGWSDGAGHTIAFMEQTTPYIRNVLFKNIDIVHTYVPAVYMTCCDATGEQYNITLDDIRVEDMVGSYDYKVFDMVTNSKGNVRDIYINNFRILGGNIPPSNISGNVSNVTFNNLNYLGNTILSPAAGQFSIGGGASNIKFTQGGAVPPPPSPTPTPPPSTPSCTNLWNSSLAVPASFAASFNWFTSAKELLMQAFCGSAGAYINVGNGSQFQYIYKTGYTWTNNQWTPFNYSGQTMDAGNNWFIGSASNAFAGIDLTQKQSVLAYICDWNGSSWKCGCHDSSCATSCWNLQQFKQ